MKLIDRIRLGLLPTVIIFFLSMLFISPITADANDETAPGRKLISADPVSPALAWNIVNGRSLPTIHNPSLAVPAEISALARGLGNDADHIYTFVHDSIDYEVGYGVNKGALGCLLDGRGNAFDQVELMVALLRAAGYTASIVHGTIELTGEQASNWLGVDNEVGAVRGILGAAGVPASTSPETGGGELSWVTISHVWVQVEIDGAAYVFDPAFKEHTYTSALDYASFMTFDQDDLLSRVGGETHTADDTAADDYSYTEGISRPELLARIALMATRLKEHIDENLPQATITDVVGGRAINPASEQVRQTILPYVDSENAVWQDDIPNQFHTIVTMQAGGVNVAMRSRDFYARRLTLFPVEEILELRLDGMLIGSGSAGEILTISVDHPYAAADDTGQTGKYGDQTGQVKNIDTASLFILNGFGNMGRGVVERGRKNLKELLQSDPAADSEPVLGSTLGQISFNYLAQLSQSNLLFSQINEAEIINHHTMGVIMRQNKVLMMDLALCRSSQAAYDGDDSRALSGFLAYAGWASILESGVIEQTQGINSVSATAVFDKAALAQDRIIKATPENWNHIWVSLNLHDAQDLSTEVEQFVYSDEPWHVIIPVANEFTEGGWSGHGALLVGIDENGDTDWTNVVHLIDGLKGGVGVTGGMIGPEAAVNINPQGAYCPKDRTSYPIDLVDGRFFHNYDDLTVGSGVNALTFTRSYYSSNRLNDSGLGYGWGHNFSASFELNTDGFKGLGEYSPKKASAAITAFYSVSRLLRNNQGLDRLLISAVIQNWLMEQLIDNTALINFPGGGEEFYKYPNGAYEAEGCCSSGALTVEDDGSALLIKDGFKYKFNESGQFRFIQDSYYSTEWTYVYYNTSGKITRIANNYGRTIYFTYTGDRITSITGGGTVTYGYDDDGRMTSSTDPMGRTTTYVYDSKNRLTHIYKPSDSTTPFVLNTYDDLDRVASQSVAGHPASSYYFSPIRTEEIDPLGNSEVRWLQRDWRRNKRQVPVKLVDRLGRETTFEYDGWTRNIRTVYPEGNAVEKAYDEKNNVVAVTLWDKDGQNSLTTQYTYHDTYKKFTSITDPLGRYTEFTYNSYGRINRLRLPAVNGTVPEIVFTHAGSFSRGPINSITTPDGKTTAITYNSKYDVTAVTEDSGGLALTTTLGRNAAGDITAVTDPLGNATTLSYDAVRRLIETAAPSPLSYITAFGYDLDGNPSSVARQGPPVQTASSTYSLTGRILTEVSPEGRTTTYTYDDLDRLSTVTDAEGRSTIYVYDALGRVLRVLDGDGHAEEAYTYTDNGRVHTVTDGNGNVTTYTYDGFDRLIAATYPNGSTETLTLDEAGRVQAVNTRGGQTIAYDYDALDRLTRRNIPGSGEYTYTYDGGSRITVAAGPGGSINFTYDTAGRLESATYPGGQQVRYAYDAASNRTSLTYPDGSEAGYVYDALGRLTAVNQDPDGSSGEEAAVQIAAYTYDALSRRTNLTNGNGSLADYAYNLDNNLTSLNHQWTGESATLNYAYDNTGLQTGYSSSDDRFAPLFEALGTKTNTPNNLNQYVTAAGQNLTYNGNGALTNDGTRTYTYDAANRLLTAQNGQSATYAYDPFDRRRSKTVDSQAVTFIYDGDQIIAEYDDSGLTKKFIYGPGIDEPIMMQAGETKYYYHADRLGSIIALADSTGNLVDTYRYSVYGEVDNPGSLGNPFLYTGREFDSETGLYYYRARYYDAGLRRFLQPDPIGYLGGMNLYAYVGNDPINGIDPFGLETRIIICRESVFGLSVGHVSLWIERGGYNDQPMVYDPSGSYLNDINRNHLGIFEGEKANWQEFLAHQKTNGTEVDIFIFNTTIDDEKMIAERAKRLGDPRGFNCARYNSEAIRGIGPFATIERTRFPGNLKRQLQKLKK